MSKRKQLTIAVLGILIFGVLMGIRQNLPSLWMRVGVAAIAGGIYGVVFMMACKLGQERHNRH